MAAAMGVMGLCWVDGAYPELGVRQRGVLEQGILSPGAIAAVRGVGGFFGFFIARFSVCRRAGDAFSQEQPGHSFGRGWRWVRSWRSGCRVV